MTSKDCKGLHHKWKACVALCKKFKLEQKKNPKRSRGRASKENYKSLRARSPSPNPDTIQPPAFHSHNRERGMSLVPSGGTSEASAEPVFAEIHFPEKHGFSVATCVCLSVRDSSDCLANGFVICLMCTNPSSCRGTVEGETKPRMPQVQCW